MNIEQNILDRLCAITKSAEQLNTIHACRDNHPLGKNNPYIWRNVYWIAIEHESRISRSDFSFFREKVEQETYVNALLKK